MSELLQEYFNGGREKFKIDRELGVISGVKIIGTKSRNKRLYPKDVLENAVRLYENAKVNLDHPNEGVSKPRSYHDRFGTIRNIRFEEDGLYADFHFNPRHSIAEQLLWDAENSPENVGFSHNVEAVLERGEEVDTVRKIVSVRSVDLVADPASTNGLFESFEDDSKKRDETESIKNELETAKRKIGVLESTIQAAERLIRETGNPACEILSERFLENLEYVTNLEAAEGLIKERIALIEKFGRHSSGGSSPVSREQTPTGEGKCDKRSFLEAITGR